LSELESVPSRYLLDVNVVIALLFQDHFHYELVTGWFSTPDLQWSVCAFAEAGFLRHATAPHPWQLTMAEATELIKQLTRHPNCQYLPVDADWQALCSPFFPRLQGTKQVTDAYLLGLAVRGGLVLVTMDKGILHLAGSEYSKHVLLLKGD
jgi:predicted nucleic acid-binding protein